MNPVATVRRKGQITIPVEVRRQMGLLEGEQVEFQVKQGVTTIRRFVNASNPFAKWAGNLGGSKVLNDSVEWQRDLRGED